MSNIKTALLWVGVGLVVGLLPFALQLYSSQDEVVQQNECFKKYNFTDQSLDCTTYENSSSRLGELNEKLNQATVQYISGGKAARIGVWVRDLKTGQWAASNEFETFVPASLLKVPLMITYYRFAQVEPAILGTKLVYYPIESVVESSQERFAPKHKLIPGQEYSVEELIEYMVTESDNTAMILLSEHMNQTFLNNTLVELGIRLPTSGGDVSMIDFITPKTYANLFRILYGATYLNRDFSQKALEILSRTTFEGMKTSIPKNVLVLHKFGERQENDAMGQLVTHQLHDCGIVYKTPHPYSICIMTQGKNFDDLLFIIKDISALTYEQMF